MAKPAENTKAERITGVSGLIQILKGAELEHTVDGESVRLKFEDSGWEFPVSLTVDSERERILCDLSLVEIEKQESIDREAMLRLMAAGDPSQSAFFAFDPAEKVIQLRASLSSRNVTATGLKGDLQRLARFADSQSKLWSGLGAKSTPELESKAKPASPSQPKTANSGLSLEGRWSAAVGSGEAFAVQFDSGGRFALVHIKAGKSTKSTGKAIRTGDNLVLQGDTGTKLNCTLIWTDAKAFQLAINDASGKANVKIDFKKQS